MYILYNFISFKRYLFFILASLLFRHFKWNIYISLLQRIYEKLDVYHIHMLDISTHGILRGEKDIPGGEVSVDAGAGLQVPHGTAHLQHEGVTCFGRKKKRGCRIS